MWQRTWGEHGSIANGVAATSTDVYVTGGTGSLERQSDAILLTFSADGTLWNNAWGGEGFAGVMSLEMTLGMSVSAERGDRDRRVREI